jgi:chromosome segregation ATPase
MKTRRLVALFTIVLILSSTFGFVNAQDGLTIGAQVEAMTVGVEETTYEPGDSVEISGNAGSLANVSIMVFDGYTYILDLNVTAEEDGEYVVEFDLSEDAENGTYTVTVSTDGESLQAIFYVMVQDLEELAENLISQAEDSQENIEDIFEDLEEDGIDIPSGANENYTLGVAALAVALAHFEDGNYTEAGDHAYDAVLLFGAAFELVQDLVPAETPDGDDDEGVEADEGEPQGLNGIRIALERAYAYWEKLNETVTNFREDGYDVSEIREVLDAAKTVLDESGEHVMEGNFTAAREDFTRVKSVLGRINGLLKSTIKTRKENQAEQFMEQFQRRIQNMNGTIARIQDKLDGVNAQNFQNTLNNTAEKLQRLRGRLSEDDLEDILDELDDAVEEVEDDLDELDGRGFSAQIKNLNKVEAKIRTLNRTAERLRERGWNTTDTDQELEDADDLWKELKEMLEEGETESVKEFLEDMEDRFEDLKDELKENLKENRRITTAQRKAEEAISSIQRRVQERKHNFDELKEEIVSLTRKATALSGRGMNVSDIQAYLSLAREKLGEALEQTDLASDASQGLAREVENLIDKVEDLIEDFLEILGEPGSSETGETRRNRLGIVGDDDDDEPDDEEPPEEGTNSTTAVTTG